MHTHAYTLKQPGLPFTKADLRNVTVQFDGGTPCNCPKRGYGFGYGSFKIDDDPVQKCQFERMSANAAEVWTLIYALRSITGDRRGIRLIVKGDSRIALNCTNMALRRAKKGAGGSDEYIQAYRSLCDAVSGFGEVKTAWHPRTESVKLFGH